MTEHASNGWRARLAAKKRNGSTAGWDVDVRGPHGRRHRISLGTLDRETAEKRFDLWVRSELPILKREALAAPTGPDPKILTILDHYTELVLPNKNAAKKTRTAADAALQEFYHWCKRHKIGRMSQISRAVMDRYAVELHNHLAPKTVATRLGLLRAAFNAAVDSEMIPHSPVRKWLVPTLDEPHIEPLTPEEVGTVLEAVRCVRPAVYNAVAWIAHTGNRPSDTAALLRTQVDLRTGTVARTQVKTRRVARYEISPAALAIVRAELARKVGEPYVFTTATGRPWSVNKLYHQFTRALAVAEYPRKVTLKDLRHSFASNLANDPDHPCPLPVLQRLMGHERIETTMKYVRPTDGAPYVAHYAERLAKSNGHAILDRDRMEGAS